jgi:hypothetical protein
MNSRQSGAKRSWPNLECHPRIMFGAFRKTNEYLQQDRRVQAGFQMEQFPDIKESPFDAVFKEILRKRCPKLVQPSLCIVMFKH